MKKICVLLLLAACAHTWNAPPDFKYQEISAGKYTIATWARDRGTGPLRIYIEGDGRAFDGFGRPTRDPTPHSTFLRDLVAQDTAHNVIYMARPCQYVMTPACTQSDWTDGRFSADIINAMGDVVASVGAGRPITLIGYSGGALLSALIIEARDDINVSEWITVAGVLNHADWTNYFNDTPLARSMNVNGLPCVSQRHYIAPGDKIVPNSLSYKWLAGKKIITVPNATHTKFPNFVIK